MDVCKTSVQEIKQYISEKNGYKQKKRKNLKGRVDGYNFKADNQDL